MSKKFKDTKLGKFLKDKAPNILNIVGTALPDKGVLGIVKNLVDVEPSLTPEEKQQIHKQVTELYELEVADRDSARKREVEIAKVRKFYFIFNLTGLVGLGTFVFLVYCIVLLIH